MAHSLRFLICDSQPVARLLNLIKQTGNNKQDYKYS